MLQEFDRNAVDEEEEEDILCKVRIGGSVETVPLQPQRCLEFPYEMREPSRNEKAADEQCAALILLLQAPGEEDLSLSELV